MQEGGVLLVWGCDCCHGNASRHVSGMNHMSVGKTFLFRCGIGMSVCFKSFMNKLYIHSEIRENRLMRTPSDK